MQDHQRTRLPKALALLTAELERRFQLENGFVFAEGYRSRRRLQSEALEATLDHIEFGPMPSADRRQ